MALLMEGDMRRPFQSTAAVVGLFLMAVSQASADVLIAVNKSDQQMTVTVNGTTRWVWPVSTGRPEHDTPAGSFRPVWMDEDHYSKEWDNAPMPYSIFFTDSGHAIHGTLSTKQLGSPASHGCVRLAVQNAEKLFALVREQGLSNTSVVLADGRQSALGPPRVASQKRAGSNLVAEAARAPSAPAVKSPLRYAISQTFGEYQPDTTYDRFR
jgi:hypothetical protein